MRYILVAILVGAGAPAASALPTVGPIVVAASKAEAVIQVAKRSRQSAHRASRKDNGIHPLVGSGDY
jgi:hypothetical protein